MDKDNLEMLKLYSTEAILRELATRDNIIMDGIDIGKAKYFYIEGTMYGEHD